MPLLSAGPVEQLVEECTVAIESELNEEYCETIAARA